MNDLCNTARACVRVREKTAPAAALAGELCTDRHGGGRYALARAAANELIDVLGGSRCRDLRIWAYYCYHHDIAILLDRAHELASCHRQGEIRNPPAAFQRWLTDSFGVGAAAEGARGKEAR